MESEHIKNGAFLVARKLFSSEVWLHKPSSWKVIWIYILGNVAHKDDGKFQRGRGFFMFSKCINDIGNDITIDMIKKSISFFKKNEMIRTERSTRGMYIEVLKYNDYQTLDNYSSTNQSTREAPEKHQRSTPIHKYVKNVSSKEEEREPASPTPSQIATNFFEKGKDYEEMLVLFTKNNNKDFISEQFEKFILYWTEPNKSGTKVRWQQESTFEVRRRLLTWFSRSKQFNQVIKTNRSTPNFIL